MIYNCTRWSISVERTLRYFGEDLGHGVHPLLHIPVGYSQHLGAIGGELSSKESIHQVHLSDNVNQIQELAKDEFVDIQIVCTDVSEDVVNYDTSSVLGCLWLGIKTVLAQVLQQEGQLSSFPGLP